MPLILRSRLSPSPCPSPLLSSGTHSQVLSWRPLVAGPGDRSRVPGALERHPENVTQRESAQTCPAPALRPISISSRTSPATSKAELCAFPDLILSRPQQCTSSQLVARNLRSHSLSSAPPCSHPPFHSVLVIPPRHPGDYLLLSLIRLLLSPES